MFFSQSISNIKQSFYSASNLVLRIPNKSTVEYGYPNALVVNKRLLIKYFHMGHCHKWYKARDLAPRNEFTKQKKL